MSEKTTSTGEAGLGELFEYGMLDLDFDLPPIEEKLDKTKAKTAQKKKAEAKYVPTWDEVWIHGYDPGSGKRKAGILQTKLTDTDRKRAIEVKEALENGEIQRSADKAGKPISKSEALSLHPLLVEVRREKILEKMSILPENYAIIETVAAFKQFLPLLWAESIVALDTETNGLDCHGESRIVGLCFTLPTIDRHYYIPVGHKQQIAKNGSSAVADWFDYVFGALKGWFEDWRARKVLHNARFDAHMLSQHDVKLRGIHWDTMIAQKLLNENEESVALKNLANKYGHLFGYEDDSYTYEQLFGKNTPFDEVDYNRGGGYYAAKDGHLTNLLFRWQESHFSRLPRLDWLYRNIENPLIPASIAMERTGFLIDLEYSTEFGRILQDEIAVLLDRMKDVFAVSMDFNFDSNPQLAELLYDRLKLPNKSKGSVDAKALKFLQSEHKGIPLILEYREKQKLFGTYVEALPQKITKDGRLHGSFNQVGTVTGRFSSNDPNLQNLPPAGRKLIKAPNGWVIQGSDFSQIEPRCLAHISGDPDLQQIYIDGKDIYTEMAVKVYGVTHEEAGDGSKYRKAMKVVVLAIMYGLSAYSLGESLKISTDAAEQLIEDFYKAYPKVYEWIQSVWEQVKANEYVETLYGRKRRFPGHREQAIIYDEAAAEICKILELDKAPSSLWAYGNVIPYELKKRYNAVAKDVSRVRRMAVNAIIQGTAADIMKLALIGLHEYTERKGWALNGTVHDEALLLVPETITLADVEEMESIMTSVVELAVPLKCDTEMFRRYGEGIKKSEWFEGVAA